QADAPPVRIGQRRRAAIDDGTSDDPKAVKAGSGRVAAFPERRIHEVYSTLLAEHHREFTRPGAVVVQDQVRDCAACGFATGARRRATPICPRSHGASIPRTAPASFVVATCTALSRRPDPCGWSARRGCWS